VERWKKEIEVKKGVKFTRTTEKKKKMLKNNWKHGFGEFQL